MRTPANETSIIAGFRADGSLSVYFGADPYYQFDVQGRLRRAFVGDRLYRTQGDGLAALARERSNEATVLARHDLEPAELDRFRQSMRDRIDGLRQSLAAGRERVLRQVPEGTPILPRLADSLDTVLKADGALAPPINVAH